MVMMRITTAVDRRLGFGYHGGYHNRAPEFTGAAGMAPRLEVLRTKLLKKAVQIELDELMFWMKELKRSHVDFQAVRMLAQRIRTLREGLPSEFVPACNEEDVASAIHRHAVKFAKQKLSKLKERVVEGWTSDDNERVDFLRFIRTYDVSLEELGFSKIQFHHLTQQAGLVWEEACKEHRRQRELRRQNK